jgi:general secretion pathway protein A
MSYLNYWRLRRSPFSLTRPAADYFVRGSIEEAYARCEFLTTHERRLGLLVGPNGAGKSSFLRYLRTRTDCDANRNYSAIDLQGTTPVLLAEKVRDAFAGDICPTDWFVGNHRSESRSLGKVIGEIDDALLASGALGRQHVLLFDNAEDASEDALETLGILLKRPGKWTAILAVDELVLVDLPRKVLEACELKIDLPAWDLALTADFIEFALARAGQQEEVFSVQAITRIHELCDGIARRMIQLADFALIAAAAQQLPRIETDLVDATFDEFSILPGAKFQVL